MAPTLPATSTAVAMVAALGGFGGIGFWSQQGAGSGLGRLSPEESPLSGSASESSELAAISADATIDKAFVEPSLVAKEAVAASADAESIDDSPAVAQEAAEAVAASADAESSDDSPAVAQEAAEAAVATAVQLQAPSPVAGTKSSMSEPVEEAIRAEEVPAAASFDEAPAEKASASDTGLPTWAVEAMEAVLASTGDTGLPAWAAGALVAVSLLVDVLLLGKIIACFRRCLRRGGDKLPEAAAASRGQRPAGPRVEATTTLFPKPCTEEVPAHSDEEEVEEAAKGIVTTKVEASVADVVSPAEAVDNASDKQAEEETEQAEAPKETDEPLAKGIAKDDCEDPEATAKAEA